MATVSVTGLQRAAEKYNKDFKVLPFALLIPAMMALGIRMLKVNNKDTIIEQQRKGGISKPYKADGTDTVNTDAIMKLSERSLQVLSLIHI